MKGNRIKTSFQGFYVMLVERINNLVTRVTFPPPFFFYVIEKFLLIKCTEILENIMFSYAIRKVHI